MLTETLNIYSKDNSYLILNPRVPAWIVTNITGAATIKEYAECLSFEKTAEKINFLNSSIKKESVVKFLKNADNMSLFKEEPQTKHFHKPYFLNALYLNMTERCNLKCSYCFASSRNELGSSAITLDKYREILNSAKKISNGDMSIIFTGGEPLLSENTIPAAQYAKELGYSTRLLTNATLIDKSNAEKLASIFDLFKISMDGSTAEIHDYYRGHGSYQKTLHAIELLKSYNANVQIAMTVTRENVNDISEMNRKWGETLTFQPLFPLGRAKDNSNILTGEEYYESLCVYERINPFSDIESIINAHMKNHSIMKCSLGDGELSISCTGDVYPCQLLHDEKFYLGNIQENTLEEIYKSPKNNNFKTHTVDCIDKCKICDFKYLCGGACQARHFSETGSIDKAGDFCEYEKKGIINGLITSCKMIEL
ncbi:MAG: radical SAM protein [Treponema sp.]|nr:radical SAM protein [Treponema sp.]